MKNSGKRTFALKSLLCLCLLVCLTAGICAPAYADASGTKGSGLSFGNMTGNSTSDNQTIGKSKASVKERVDQCNSKYNAYQKIKSYRDTAKLDSYAMVRTIEGVIKQIDIQSTDEASYYSPLEDYSVIYYYDDGLPYFALYYYEGTKPREQIRFYLSESEIVKWIDSDGEESYEAPDEFFYVYDHAVAAYARAMYDRYGKGRYAIQAGCFKDKDDAEDCCNSLVKQGVEARVQVIDEAYCVLIGKYKDWDSANDARNEIDFTDDCGIVLIRLI